MPHIMAGKQLAQIWYEEITSRSLSVCHPIYCMVIVCAKCKCTKRHNKGNATVKAMNKIEWLNQRLLNKQKKVAVFGTYVVFAVDEVGTVLLTVAPDMLTLGAMYAAVTPVVAMASSPASSRSVDIQSRSQSTRLVGDSTKYSPEKNASHANMDMSINTRLTLYRSAMAPHTGALMNPNNGRMP